MSIYGLTTDGLIVKTLAVIREELSDRLKAKFGVSVKSDSDRAILGQMVAIISEAAALVWEQLETVNSSMDPDKASGAALDALCTLTGTFRPPAEFSTVTLTLTGMTGEVVPEGSQAETESTGVRFETMEDATFAAATAWTALTGYSIGDIVTNGGNIYYCTDAGTSAGAGGPTGTSDTITDATVEWAWLGAGDGYVDVVAQALETGALTAIAGDLNTITTPVFGWEGCVNILDATEGRDLASDEELRMIREAELAGIGNTPIDALRADLLGLSDDIVAVTVFVNNTDTTNSDGMPPHSVECLIRPKDPAPAGFDQMIYDALLQNVAAGILTHGTWTPGTAVDEQGTEHTMMYSRPEEIEIYVIVDVTVDEDEYPTDGDDLIKQAIADWGDLQATGKNAVASGVSAQAFTIDGVIDVTSVKIGTAPTPTLSVTIPISLRQLAVFDTSRITVNSTPGTP